MALLVLTPRSYRLRGAPIGGSAADPRAVRFPRRSAGARASQSPPFPEPVGGTKSPLHCYAAEDVVRCSAGAWAVAGDGRRAKRAVAITSRALRAAMRAGKNSG